MRSISIPTGTFIILLNCTLCSSSATSSASHLLKRSFHQVGLLTKANLVFPVNVNVIHSGVLDVAPWLELHHVVLISEPESTLIYALDYSPINQQENIMKLLCGQNVKAEIRVRILKADDVNDIEEIKRRWCCLSCDLENKQSLAVTINKVDEEYCAAKKFIRRIEKRWSTSMNLYTHNCQHFSRFVTDLLKEEEICLI